MTKSESLCSEVLLPLSTMLANGEILFVCNRSDAQIWMQAYAFYDYTGCLYAVTKDFAGIFQREPGQPSNPFIECRAYFLSDDAIIVNIKGEVVAACNNYQWTLPLPGTTLAEFTRNVQSQQNTDEAGNESSNRSSNKNLDPSSRCALKGLSQWLRRVFPNKNPASV